MSYKVSNAVRDHSLLKGKAFQFLSCVASYCNHSGNMDGAKYTPSLQTLANGARMTKPTAIKCRQMCIDSGELSIRQEGKGRGAKCYYTIHLNIDNDDSFAYDDYTKSESDNKKSRIERLEYQVESIEKQLNLLIEMVKDTQEMVKTTVKNQSETANELDQHELVPVK